MKILMQTTYYLPHVSGLTHYFNRLAEAYAKQGHQVIMLTSKYDKNLSKVETINGVEIIRSSYLFRLNKGIFYPKVIWDGFKALRRSDVIHFNLPSVESLPLAILAKLMRKKIVTTYVCDITLPRFFLSRLLDKTIDLIHLLTLSLSDEIASFTKDFCDSSRVLKKFKSKVKEIYPPIDLPTESEQIKGLDQIKSKHHPIIGMATRIAADKGVNIMIDALGLLSDQYPNIALVIAGEECPIGEEKYWQKVKNNIENSNGKIFTLGKLKQSQMQTFYKNIDILGISSTNSTEAFGLVQVEAMFEGTPVVVSDLPGVRVPATITKMGKVTKIGDSKDLAQAIDSILSGNVEIKSQEELRQIFNTENSVHKYLQLYQD